MQRMQCRYCRDASVETLGLPAIRTLFIETLEQAGCPLDDGRRNLLFGPALPSGATSDDERCVIALRIPCDPHELCRRMNDVLPAGLRLRNAWILPPPQNGDALAQLDETVYQVLWRNAPAAAEVAERLPRFFAQSDVELVREREKKVQRLNVRALVHQLRLGEVQPGVLRLLMTVSVGPRGAVRPDEVLQVLGYPATTAQLAVHRLAVRHATPYRPATPRVDAWRRERDVVFAAGSELVANV